MPERPRVLVLTPDFLPVHGGVQLLVHRLVASWERVDARVVTRGTDGARAFDLTLPFPVRRAFRVPLLGARAELATLNALALAEGLRFRPHAVLSGHIVAAPAARALRTALDVPYVQYLHGEEVTRRQRLARLAIASAAAVVAVSDHTASLARGLDAPADRLHRIPPGVDLRPPAPPIASRPPLIAAVARLDDRYKGHDVVLRAFPLVRARVPEARLVVVGDGRLRPAYESLARAVGVSEAVEFRGGVGDAERDALLDDARVFVMPSRLSPTGGGEGFGIVYLEAAVHGVPVVAGRAAGALDAVVDGVTGVLVDPEDHVGLAEAVSRLLATPAEAETLGRAGAERARGFAWPIIARRVEDLVLEVVEGCR